MTRSRLLLTLVPLAAALLASRASASSIPSVVNSTLPTAIRLVGTNGTAPDAVAGQFTMVLRLASNDPIDNAHVIIDFSQCPDMELCTDQLDANATVNCAAKTVQKFTNVSGQVQFVILGHSHGAADASMALERARMYGNGVFLGTPTVSAFDLDGTAGVGANDLSTWLRDFGSGLNPTRSDYDASGAVTANDLALWIQVFGAGRSALSCASSCP